MLCVVMRCEKNDSCAEAFSLGAAVKDARLAMSLSFSVGSLLAVFRLLHGGAAAVGTGDVGLLLGFRFHLAAGAVAAAGGTERHAAFYYLVDVHSLNEECRIKNVELFSLRYDLELENLEF